MRPLLFENCRSYLLAHATPPPPGTPPPPLRAITISRQTGAGAITVGRLLMNEFENRPGHDPHRPWAVFDRELVQRVLRDHKLPSTLEPYLPEDSRPKVIDVIEDLLGIHPPNWTLVEHTKHTILRLAETGNVIIVGRGGNLVTKSLGHVFHVRLVAPINTRVRHIRDYYNLSQADAVDFIKKEDRARARYIREHFAADVEDSLQYHLTINTGLIGFPQTAHLIADAVLQTMSASPPRNSGAVMANIRRVE